MERQMGVYMLLCGGGTLYTGWTNDLERRLSAHMSGRGCKYTASHQPVQLVYFEPQPSRSAALRREAAIKRLPRAQKQALIFGPSNALPFLFPEKWATIDKNQWTLQ